MTSRRSRKGYSSGYVDACRSSDDAYAGPMADPDHMLYDFEENPLVNADSLPYALPESRRPARLRQSTFGDDDELAKELPPNWTLKKFQTEAKAALDELFLSRSIPDSAVRVARLLSACPSEADEFCVIALRVGLDHDESCQEATLKLLINLREKYEDSCDCSALVRSFEKLWCTWEDIAIDAPKAPEVLLKMLRKCIDAELVDRSLLTKVPENMLNAGLKTLKDSDPATAEIFLSVQAKLKQFKKDIVDILDEYFVACEVDAVETYLNELHAVAYHHEFVKKVIIKACSQAKLDPARDAAIALLSRLTLLAVLTKDDLQWGLARLLGSLDDLVLDCPKIVDLSVKFVSALVSEELVSVPFLYRCKLLRIGGKSGKQVVDAVSRRLPEYAKKHYSVTRFKQEIQAMILEYFEAGDLAEFGRCVSELAPLAPAQSSELVRKIMGMAMERSGAECESAFKLLVSLYRHEELDAEALEAGFDELYSRLPDLLLDVPEAREKSWTFVQQAKTSKLLRNDWTCPPDLAPGAASPACNR